MSFGENSIKHSVCACHTMYSEAIPPSSHVYHCISRLGIRRQLALSIAGTVAAFAIVLSGPFRALSQEGKPNAPANRIVTRNQAQAELEKGGARFEMDLNGNVTGVVLGGRATNDSLSLLTYFPRLERVYIYCAHDVTDDGLSHLVGLPGIKVLWFGYSRITDHGLLYVSTLTTLRELHIGIDDTMFDDDGLPYIERLTSLRKLTLVRTKVSDAGLKQIRLKMPDCRIEAR